MNIICQWHIELGYLIQHQHVAELVMDNVGLDLVDEPGKLLIGGIPFDEVYTTGIDPYDT